MKTRKVKPIRYRLTASFMFFAVLLMGILWLMQVAFLSGYYEMSMRNKCESALNTVSNVYSTSESLTYEDFCNVLSSVSSDNDVYFYVEAVDQSFYISSSEDLGRGRIYRGAQELIDQAKLDLVFGDNEVVSVSSDFDKATMEKTIVYATLSHNKKTVPIYIYAVTSLTPIGPAVSIIRSQLLIITAISLVLAIIIARWLSKRLSKPIIDMSGKAKLLALGNYDVVFDGGEYQEVDQLASTLTEAASDLKKTDALQKDLMANVSHDLRTPLTMIKSYAEMIKDISGDIPEKRNQHLDVIIEETDRLSDLVNDVLTLSKMQSGVTELEYSEFDIQKAARSVLSTFLVLENEGYSFHFDELDEETIVNGDERKLQQVIANLLSNAVKYSADKKDIRLGFILHDGKIRCYVSDKGVGIPKEDQEKIWHRYERVSDNAQRPLAKGTGLGLSIAAEILDLHNATYGVDSEENEGSTFWFEL